MSIKQTNQPTHPQNLEESIQMQGFRLEVRTVVYSYGMMKMPETAVAQNDLEVIKSYLLKTRFETNIVAEKTLKLEIAMH